MRGIVPLLGLFACAHAPPRGDPAMSLAELRGVIAQGSGIDVVFPPHVDARIELRGLPATQAGWVELAVFVPAVCLNLAPTVGEGATVTFERHPGPRITSATFQTAHLDVRCGRGRVAVAPR